jgi:cobyrinic acid a,c-diamide synthase
LQFDPAARIKGVILNQVAGARHEKIARDSIEQFCKIPVLGAMPKLKKQSFPERHMGLVPTYEHQWAHDAVDAIAELAEKYLDIPAISAVAQVDFKSSGTLAAPSVIAQAAPVEVSVSSGDKPRIGVIHDSAFQFYYPENMDALVQAGAEVVITSPLYEDSLPRIDALYIGGGFPETHAARLTKNLPYREQIRTLAAKGLPIYAECGGLMYLGRELILEEGTFAMCGVLPVTFGFAKRPQGHGYTIFRVARDNPFLSTGQIIRGHEFHYSTVRACDADPDQMVFDMQRGSGLASGRDGLCINNVLATYTHIHALGTPQWAPAMVSQARRFQKAS